MEASGQSLSLPQNSERKHRTGSKRANKGLRKYLRVLNVSLAYYAAYVLFFVYMLRNCHAGKRCFLDSNTNHLLLLLAVFAFGTHLAVSAISFIKHRRNKSRRLRAHQIISLLVLIIAVMLVLFKGMDFISDVIAEAAA